MNQFLRRCGHSLADRYHRSDSWRVSGFEKKNVGLVERSRFFFVGFQWFLFYRVHRSVDRSEWDVVVFVRNFERHLPGAKSLEKPRRDVSPLVDCQTQCSRDLISVQLPY